jgi:hypothetical protein
MKHRMGLDNVFLLEATAMVAARPGSRSPALVFLDILAAFPSILHDYILASVHRFLGDHPPFGMIRDVYSDNTCDLVLPGERYPGFQVLCGVRQGCPLSGSLFALAEGKVLIIRKGEGLVAGLDGGLVQVVAQGDEHRVKFDL